MNFQPIQPSGCITRPKSVLNPPKRKRRIYYPQARSVTPIEISEDGMPNNDLLVTSPLTTISPSETDTPQTPSQYCYNDDNTENSEEYNTIKLSRLSKFANSPRKPLKIPERIGNDEYFIRSLLKSTDPYLPPISTSLPSSLIPSSYYISSKSPIYKPHAIPTNIIPRPNDNMKKSDKESIHFENVLFPSANPNGRDQVAFLNSTLELMLKKSKKVLNSLMNKLQNPNINHYELLYNFDYNINIYNEFKLWNIVLREITRQVYSECDSRGILLERVRSRYETIIKLSMHLYNTLKFAYREIVEKYHHCLEELEKDPTEKEKERLLEEAREREERIKSIDKTMEGYYKEKKKLEEKSKNVFYEIEKMETAMKFKNKNVWEGDFTMLMQEFHTIETFIGGMIKNKEEINDIIKPLGEENGIDDFLNELDNERYSPDDYINLLKNRITETQKFGGTTEETINLIRTDTKVIDLISDREYKDENELRDLIQAEVGDSYLIEFDDYNAKYKEELKKPKYKTNIGNLISGFMLTYMSYHTWNDIKYNYKGKSGSNSNNKGNGFITYEICYQVLEKIMKFYNTDLYSQKLYLKQLRDKLSNSSLSMTTAEQNDIKKQISIMEIWVNHCNYNCSLLKLLCQYFDDSYKLINEISELKKPVDLLMIIKMFFKQFNIEADEEFNKIILKSLYTAVGTYDNVFQFIAETITPVISDNINLVSNPKTKEMFKDTKIIQNLLQQIENKLYSSNPEGVKQYSGYMKRVMKLAGILNQCTVLREKLLTTEKLFVSLKDISIGEITEDSVIGSLELLVSKNKDEPEKMEMYKKALSALKTLPILDDELSSISSIDEEDENNLENNNNGEEGEEGNNKNGENKSKKQKNKKSKKKKQLEKRRSFRRTSRLSLNRKSSLYSSSPLPSPLSSPTSRGRSSILPDKNSLMNPIIPKTCVDCSVQCELQILNDTPLYEPSAELKNLINSESRNNSARSVLLVSSTTPGTLDTLISTKSLHSNSNSRRNSVNTSPIIQQQRISPSQPRSAPRTNTYNENNNLDKSLSSELPDIEIPENISPTQFRRMSRLQAIHQIINNSNNKSNRRSSMEEYELKPEDLVCEVKSIAEEIKCEFGRIGNDSEENNNDINDDDDDESEYEYYYETDSDNSSVYDENNVYDEDSVDHVDITYDPTNNGNEQPNEGNENNDNNKGVKKHRRIISSLNKKKKLKRRKKEKVDYIKIFSENEKNSKLKENNINNEGENNEENNEKQQSSTDTTNTTETTDSNKMNLSEYSSKEGENLGKLNIPSVQDNTDGVLHAQMSRLLKQERYNDLYQSLTSLLSSPSHRRESYLSTFSELHDFSRSEDNASNYNYDIIIPLSYRQYKDNSFIYDDGGKLVSTHFPIKYKPSENVCPPPKPKKIHHRILRKSMVDNNNNNNSKRRLSRTSNVYDYDVVLPDQSDSQKLMINKIKQRYNDSENHRRLSSIIHPITEVGEVFSESSVTSSPSGLPPKSPKKRMNRTGDIKVSETIIKDKNNNVNTKMQKMKGSLPFNNTPEVDEEKEDIEGEGEAKEKKDKEFKIEVKHMNENDMKNNPGYMNSTLYKLMQKKKALIQIQKSENNVLEETGNNNKSKNNNKKVIETTGDAISEALREKKLVNKLYEKNKKIAEMETKIESLESKLKAYTNYYENRIPITVKEEENNNNNNSENNQGGILDLNNCTLTLESTLSIVEKENTKSINENTNENDNNHEIFEDLCDLFEISLKKLKTNYENIKEYSMSKSILLVYQIWNAYNKLYMKTKVNNEVKVELSDFTLFYLLQKYGKVQPIHLTLLCFIKSLDKYRNDYIGFDLFYRFLKRLYNNNLLEIFLKCYNLLNTSNIGVDIEREKEKGIVYEKFDLVRCLFVYRTMIGELHPMTEESLIKILISNSEESQVDSILSQKRYEIIRNYFTILSGISDKYLIVGKYKIERMSFIMVMINLYSTLEMKFKEYFIKSYRKLLVNKDEDEHLIDYDQFSVLMCLMQPKLKKDVVDKYWIELNDGLVTGHSHVNYNRVLDMVYKYPNFRIDFRKQYVPNLAFN